MPTQTPGPRRFAPPSSSSSVRPTAKTGASGRFARPSQPTSSPFTRTSFASTARKDAIESDDDDDDLSEEVVSAASHRQTGQAIVKSRVGRAQTESDTVASRPLAASNHDQILIRSQGRPPSEVSKRQKVSHFRIEPLPGYPDDLTTPESSSPLHQNALPSSSNVIDDHADNLPPTHAHSEAEINDEPLASAQNSSPLRTEEDSPGKEFETPKMRTSRFRNPLTQSSQIRPDSHRASASTEVPLPSFQSRLLAATNTQSSPGQHVRGPTPSLEFVLPDAFSPSRRRGQHEYLEHGHAEVVRSWVLDIAARSDLTGTSSMITTQQTQTSESLSATTNPFTVASIVHRDDDGRFVLVTSTQDDHPWMLIDTESLPQSQSPNQIMPKSRIERLQKGSQFILKGGNVSNWILGPKDDDISDEAHLPRRLDQSPHRVAVLWDLLP